MDRVTLRATISIVSAAAIGFLLAYATGIGLALCVLMPTLCFLQKRRIHAFLVAFAYYGAASSILIPGIVSFFGPGTTLQLAFTICGTACLFLTLPFGALWSGNRVTMRWRAPLALVASVPPPLGIIGWANPLTSAGILLPGTGWFGLLAILTFQAFSPANPRISISLLAVAAVVTNLVFPGAPVPPSDWEGVDTEFGETSSQASGIVEQYETAQSIQKRALESHARVIVFPESVVPRWNEATDLFWEATLWRMRESGKILLLGAGMDIAATQQYRNVLIVRGAESAVFSQRIPVPLGMWHPFRDDGVPLNPFGPAVIAIADERVAVIICYEQFVTGTVLASLFSKPDVLLGIANHHWSIHTRIPEVQTKLLHVWGRLFRLPVVTATNV